MNKNQFLINVAETGYNVGFGSRKHWATYDIVDKVPGLIGFGSMAFGIVALIYEELSTKQLSAALLVIGLIGLYISFYDQKKAEYEASAVKLTKLCNELRDLYRSVKDSECVIEEHKDRLRDIEIEYYAVSISKQILFSDWYAHYKFFWQYQVEWIDEQKSFRFFRDKIPLSFMFCVLAILFMLIILYAKGFISFLTCLASS